MSRFRRGPTVKKKTFDAVAFMRKRREELSRAYADLSAEQIHERIQQSLKNDPLWRKSRQKKEAEKGTGHEWREDKIWKACRSHVFALVTRLSVRRNPLTLCHSYRTPLITPEEDKT
jgi:hypothetical protein